MKQEIKKKILKKFMYNRKLKYNQVWDKTICSSSHFDYYFKKILNDGILVKDEEYYELSSLGITLLTELDGEKIEIKSKPVICSFVLAYENGKVLLNKRAKQPFIDYYSVPGGKLEFNEFLEEGAMREFKEETGLDCEVELKVISDMMTIQKESNDIAHHILAFFYLAKTFSGELLKNTREGENIWIDIQELKKEKRFPELDFIIEKIITLESFERYKSQRTLFKNEIIDFKIEKL